MIMTNPLHLQSCVLSVRFMASFVNIYRRLEPPLAASQTALRRYISTPTPLFSLCLVAHATHDAGSLPR